MLGKKETAMRHPRPSALILLALVLSSPAWGRDDLCVFRKGVFLCDTAHDGGTAEIRLRFGKAGDVPFFSRSNVDSPAYPCVFRSHRFLCTGPAPNLVIPEGAQPLLGDVDGDLPDGGSVDPCYRLGRRWTCEVFVEPIGNRLITWIFGSGKGTGLLGDFDGDGLADPCMYQAGRFFCERFDSQEGRYVQVTFDLRQVRTRLGGGTPLLGDLDGDGRADPCLYAHGRLICGITPVTGGRPVRTLEESFGVEKDVPVLGDVDGE
jgi:hypothetical protein